MIVHPICKDLEKTIKSNAVNVGLDKIDFTKRYKLTKIGSKNKSDQNQMTAHCGGSIFLFGYENYVWICVVSASEYFKTSPVVNVLDDSSSKKAYTIETENSFYRLDEI